jgi:hypothetical protein
MKVPKGCTLKVGDVSKTVETTEDVWIDVNPRGYRIFMLSIDPLTGLTAKYHNNSKFVGWNEKEVKAYARKHGLTIERRTRKVNRTPREELLKPIIHAKGELKVVEERFDLHTLYFRRKNKKTFEPLVSAESAFLCHNLAKEIVAAWNERTDKSAFDVLSDVEFIVRLGGTKHTSISKIVSRGIRSEVYTLHGY